MLLWSDCHSDSHLVNHHQSCVESEVILTNEQEPARCLLQCLLVSRRLLLWLSVVFIFNIKYCILSCLFMCRSLLGNDIVVSVEKICANFESGLMELTLWPLPALDVPCHRLSVLWSVALVCVSSSLIHMCITSCALPLQELALHQSPPTFCVLCCPCPSCHTLLP